MRTGEALKKARERKGITQKELAARIYVSPSLVSRWEKGQRRIMLDELTVILEILGITIDEFKKMC